MKRLPMALLLVIVFGPAQADQRRLPEIHIHEWGVLSSCGPDMVFSGIPATPEAIPDLPPGNFVLRAPVLYFHGPEFSGTVTVSTGNGVISEVYPEPSSGGVGLTSCSWTGDFNYNPANIHERDALSTGTPWPYHLWRTGQSMTVHSAGWTESFLYYETAPNRVDYLPYPAESAAMADEWADLQALVFREFEDGVRFSISSLGALAEGGDLIYREMDPNEVHNTLRKWSRDIIDIYEVDALWNTWSQWICGEHPSGSDYHRGLVLYLVPDELLHNLSTIVLEPHGPAGYPSRLRRYILAAVPL